jgi:GNAT superfamily N-acetyltransferase
MTSEYSITMARPQDVPLLTAIEIAAAQLLAGHAPESVLNETTTLKEFHAALASGHLWVALIADRPVGFALVEILEPTAAHLKEIDVHPEHGRGGIGTELVRTVCEWAINNGYDFVTLTTFRDVPWNAPFYERLGFEVIPPNELTGALRQIIEGEWNRGLDPERRVTMRRPCTP